MALSLIYMWVDHVSAVHVQSAIYMYMVVELLRHSQCFFQDFDEGGGGQKYVNSNFWGHTILGRLRPRMFFYVCGLNNY